MKGLAFRRRESLMTTSLSFPILMDDLKEFLLFFTQKLLVEESRHGPQDMGVLLGGGFQLEGGHEERFIL